MRLIAVRETIEFIGQTNRLNKRRRRDFIIISIDFALTVTSGVAVFVVVFIEMIETESLLRRRSRLDHRGVVPTPEHSAGSRLNPPRRRLKESG